MTANDQKNEQTRCGFVALIGAPNAGKSTLTNQLVGAKVSIVTHKVQTTRARLRGIVIQGQSQIVIVDTPGIFTPKKRLDKAMVDAAWAGAQDSEIVVLIVDATQSAELLEATFVKDLKKLNRHLVIVLNKIDLVKKEALLELTRVLEEKLPFDQLFMISALKGDGVADLLNYLQHRVPLGPWLYPEDQITDAPWRTTAAEITREKLFLQLHEELPYASTVETTDWKTLKDKSVRIEQTIYVERQSQKKIAIGKNGQTLKKISMAARREISDLLQSPVHLFIFVKVRDNWHNDPQRYQEMGLDYPAKF